MQKLFKSFIGPVTLLLFIFSIIASAPSHKTTTTTRKPGFYGFTSYWNNYNGDINGEVGHQLYVSNPKAICEPGTWTGNPSIISGTLPPGLILNSAPWTITGIPTERGHWIVRMKLSNVTCNSSNYDGFEQELRFHITGTGKVNN